MKSYLPVVIILALIGLGAVLILANNNQGPTNNRAATISVTPTRAVATPTPTVEVSPAEDPTTTESTSPSAKTSSQEQLITITDTSSKLPTLNIPAGTKATWVNKSKKPIQIFSTPHPQHTDYPALNSVGNINPGAKKSFTFEEAGTYKWHNHLKLTVNGSVTVK